MRKIDDLTGKQYGYLTVLEFAGTKNRNAIWKCRCKCGKETIVDGCKIKSGRTKSCGCLISETTTLRSYKHGGTHTRLYGIFSAMLNRCKNPNNNNFKDYGGRGIKVCQEWDDSSAFPLFREWAMAHGYNDTLSIDRIDNDKGYSPDNCRWVTAKIQSNNKRNNVIITYGGETKTITQWAKETGILRDTLQYRIEAGWPIEAILTKPVARGREYASVKN